MRACLISTLSDVLFWIYISFMQRMCYEFPNLLKPVAAYGGQINLKDVREVSIARNNHPVYSHVNVTNADLSEKPTYTFKFYGLSYSLLS